MSKKSDVRLYAIKQTSKDAGRTLLKFAGGIAFFAMLVVLGFCYDFVKDVFPIIGTIFTWLAVVVVVFLVCCGVYAICRITYERYKFHYNECLLNTDNQS